MIFLSDRGVAYLIGYHAAIRDVAGERTQHMDKPLTEILDGLIIKAPYSLAKQIEKEGVPPNATH